MWENITNTVIYRQLHENTTEDGEKDAEKMDFASVRKKKHCKDDRRSKAHKRVNVQLGSCNKPHEKDETKDFRTKVNCANLGTFGDTKRCCRPGGDVVNNRNNNSSYSSRGSSKSSATSMGNTPLSVLKKERNTWTLVPTSHFDTNRNQGGGCQAYEDWPGSLGMKKGVYLETPHIDFLLCIARSGQSYDEIMSRCETALMAADVNNVTESYLIAAKYGLQNVMDTLLELIRENFILVSQTKQFLELPVDLMELFLSDTFVNVGDELDVFAAALRWVDYNKQDRLALSGRVLNCIRYEKIRPVDIRDHVEPNIHLFNGPCGPEALVNIYRKHALDCAGVDDPGPLGPRPTHDELVEEMARKPATTPGREHAQRIAAAQPDGAVAASMKGKGGGRGKGRGAKKPPPAKNEEAPDRKSVV